MAVRSPLVTGISPKEGIPGTRVILRGENLGFSADDVESVKICSLECVSTLEYISDRKLAVRTGRCIGKGDIIIVTKSGGVGSSLVGYTGKFDKVGPLQEVGFWADEDIPAVVGLVGRSPAAGALSQDLLGMQDSIKRRQSMIDVVNNEISGESIDVTKPNFSPSLYLAKTKSDASFDDLRRGLAFLKKRENYTNNSTQLMKNNIVSLIDAIDIIIEMKGNIITSRSIQRLKGSSKELENVLESTRALYGKDLERSEQADSIRSCISVLQRFKFLFFLPGNIQTFVEQGEYDKAINDYLRAKSLYEDTEIELLKSVYQEVVKEVEKLKSLLREKVLACPQSPENRRALIRQLETLGDDGQSLARQCVQVQSNWSVKQIQVQFPLEDKVLTNHESAEAVQDAVYGLCELAVTLMKDLVRISDMYAKGRLCSVEGSDVNESLEFIAMNINKLFAAFTERIQSILLRPDQKVDVGMFGENLLQNGKFLTYISEVLPYGTRVFRYTVYKLNATDIPGNVRNGLIELLFNLRAECLAVIILKAAYDVAMLYRDLDWNLKKDDTIGSYTNLPEKFESIFTKALNSVKFHALNYDASKKEKDLLSDRRLNRSSQLLIYGVIAAFFSTFESILATTKPQNVGGMSLAKRCVLMFNNLEYTHRSVFPRLEKLIVSLGYKDVKRIIEESAESFEECCVRVSQTFLKYVVHPLSDRIEVQIINNIPAWTDDGIVTGVQAYIKQAIFELVKIHAEVSSISVFLTERLIGETLNVICSDICNTFGKIPQFSRTGAMRALVDLSALEVTFKLWLTEETRVLLSTTMRSVSNYTTTTDTKSVQKHLDHFNDSMHLMLQIFQKPDDGARL